MRSTEPTTEDTDLSEEQLACYVYGIVPTSTPGLHPDVAGVDGAPLELVEHGELAAVVATIAVERPPGRRADLVAHSEVLDAFASMGPVVPVQFGSILQDRASVVAEVLAPNEERFTELLEALVGRAQFNLRARYNEAAVLAEVVAEQPEIAALRERTRDLPADAPYPDQVRLGELVAKALEVKREQDGAIVLDTVLPHTVSYNIRDGAGVDHLLDVAFLVDESRRKSFEDALESVAEAMHERARLRLLGPLAPYDFVAEG